MHERCQHGNVLGSMKNPSVKEHKAVKAYVFPVAVGPDENVWRASVPELEAKKAVTWGNTRGQAIKNIQEVAQMVIEELLEAGEPLPPSVTVSDRPVCCRAAWISTGS